MLTDEDKQWLRERFEESMNRIELAMEARIAKGRAAHMEGPANHRLLAAREARARGEFNREVIERSPEDFNFDRVILSCGHTAGLLRSDPSRKVDCLRCAEQWMQDQEQQ